MPPEIEPLAERVAHDLAQLEWTFEGATFSVGLTAGFACSSLIEQPTVAHLLSTGDRDLYKNKWLRQNPTTDPAVYEYDIRQNERHSLLEFPESTSATRATEEK